MPDLVLKAVTLWPSPGDLPRRHGRPVVEDVSFTVPDGESVALIGQSGAGKTSLARAVMGLWPGRLEGEIFWSDRKLSGLGERAYDQLRGRELVMMLQDPMVALNPVLTIGWQLREILRTRRGLSGRRSRLDSLDWLDRVGLCPADKLSRRYVHELSGGMAQRVLIAMAMACRPKLLIADEPFASLDPETAAENLRLFMEMRGQSGFSLLLITHDLELARKLCADVVVLRQGRVVESGPTAAVLKEPREAYTAELVEAAELVSAEARVRL